MLTYKTLVDEGTLQIYSQSETPRIDAEFLIMHVTGQSMAWYIAFGDSLAMPDHAKSFYDLIARRSQGEPIAYLIGHRDFWTLNLKVNKNVLIPRPDTETLVEGALECLQIGTDTHLRMLDLGTGSGAIALALAKEHKNANVVATDNQSAALDVAKSNAIHNVINNVEFRQGSWFDAINDDERFDLIASNPPYIEPDDAHLNSGDLRFEPISALVADKVGMSDLECIIETAPNFLTAHAWLIVEHGYNQAERVSQLFASNGFNNIELLNDINNLPRCTRGQLTQPTS